jgi:hypothetical protein
VKAAAEATAGVVEHLAHVDAVRAELLASRVDVVHRQDQAVDRPGDRGRDPGAVSNGRMVAPRLAPPAS